MREVKEIPLAGVIGAPVAHSRSPALHGHWLARYGIRGFYVPLHVAPGDLAAALALLPKLGFVGANVTLPHKEAALALADEASERARAIGAANTLVFGPGGRVFADNTDGVGFLANLEAGAPDWRAANGPALVLGAGGAARAVVQALIGAGVPEIRLANRTAERAEALAAAFGAKVKVIPWAEAESALAGAGLLVNTTSLGMSGQAPLVFSLAALAPGAVVNDLVYNPLETELLKAARARGALAVDGLGMLLHQAAPGFEAWFGRKPEVDAALRQAVLGS
jgi:shikimate dehydrogenase